MMMMIQWLHIVWHVADESKSINERLSALELENCRLQDELVCLHETNTDILQLEVDKDNHNS